MELIVPFVDRYGNSYWCDIEKPFVSLCHPRFRKILEEQASSDVSSDYEDDYYYRKYTFLKEHRILPSDIPQKERYEISSAQVIAGLANSPQITFEVTDGCNLKCEYCFYSDIYVNHDERKTKFLKYNEVKPFLKYLSSLWDSEKNTSCHKSIYISFYGGEPLLNVKFIKDIVRFIESRKDSERFIFSMTTNGMLLHKYIDFLVEKDFQLLISIDGNEKNNRYRVDLNNKNSFKKLNKNICNIKEHYPQFYDNNVKINSVLHNANSVEQIYRNIMEQYGKQPSIGELNDIGISDKMKDKFNKMYRSQYESVKQSKYSTRIKKELFVKLNSYIEITSFIHTFTGYVFKNYYELLFDFEKKTFPTGTCLPFEKKTFVTVNGKVLPCETVPHKYYLAYINGNDFIFDEKSIANFYNKHLRFINNQCQECYQKKICKQCFFKFNTIDKPICLQRWSLNDIKKYFKEITTFLCDNPQDYTRIMKEVILH